MEKRYSTISQTPSADGTYKLVYYYIPKDTLYSGAFSRKPYPRTDRLYDTEWTSPVLGYVTPKYVGLVEAQGISSCDYNPEKDLYA